MSSRDLTNWGREAMMVFLYAGGKVEVLFPCRKKTGCRAPPQKNKTPGVSTAAGRFARAQKKKGPPIFITPPLVSLLVKDQ